MNLFKNFFTKDIYENKMPLCGNEFNFHLFKEGINFTCSCGKVIKVRKEKIKNNYIESKNQNWIPYLLKKRFASQDPNFYNYGIKVRRGNPNIWKFLSVF